MCSDDDRKPASILCSFIPLSLPCFGSKHVSMDSQAESWLLSVLLFTHHPPTSQRTLSSLCQPPGLVHPICPLKHSPGRISPFHSQSLPWDTGPNLIAFLPILSDYVLIFFYSLGCIGVFLPVSSKISLRIVLHGDVFLIFFFFVGQVSSTFPYSVILMDFHCC